MLKDTATTLKQVQALAHCHLRKPSQKEMADGLMKFNYQDKKD
jgi:hypothetical protein